MGKISKVVGHLSEEEILNKIKETVGFWRVQKWLVILNALVDPRPAGAIALHTGLAPQTVHNLISDYNRNGAITLAGPGKGGRRNAYLSWAEEVEFLNPFIEQALRGHLATISTIHRDYEKYIGRKVHKTTVYRLLQRHSWRKVAPRPFHVDAKKKEQSEFKKNSRE